MRMGQGFCLALLLLGMGVGADGSRAQSYPTKPIQILTAGAGSGSDLLARLVANEFSVSLGQPVVVRNGPAGTILALNVTKAAPDGHTLMVTGGTLWIGPLLQEAPYDVFRDFAPISTLTRSPGLLVVNASLPARSVAELIKLAKARPGQLNYTSGSNGGVTHVGGELLKSMAGIDIVRIVYKDAQEMTDLLSGQVHLSFGGGSSVASHVKDAKLRALATSGSGPSLLYPDLPLVSETLPGFVAEQLLGLFAPAKTPEAILRRLNQEAVRALGKSEVRERLLGSGQEPVGGTPDQFAASIKADVARVSKILRDVGGKPGAP